MRPAENIEKLIKKLRFKPSDQTHNRVLSNILQALDNYEKQKSASPQPNIWRTVAKSRIAQMAAAAAIIIAICFFFTHQDQTGEIKTQQITQTAKSPAELTTFASLTFAYRQGGMEMVEQICDNALKMAGPRPASISMQEFFGEINNANSERKEL